jgi:hypothetical protein
MSLVKLRLLFGINSLARDASRGWDRIGGQTERLAMNRFIAYWLFARNAIGPWISLTRLPTGLSLVLILPQATIDL